MNEKFSTKRIAIDKANATLVLAVAITVFVIVFSLVASKALLGQRSYQSKVISKKETALKTLKDNIVATDQLNTAYQEFAGTTVNALGGNPKGNADRDGDNSRIILDALPSKYDFPALTTSIEKLIKDNGFKVSSITGTDDEIAQATNQSSTSPQPVEIPVTVSVSASNNSAKRLMELFERSIRPFQVQKLTLIGEGSKLKFSLEFKTYFQPEKSLDINKESVQ